MMALQGLAPILRRLFRGAVNPPKAKRHHEASTPTASSYYEGMHGDYRWFRQDELVRRCVLVNAFFATMASGFETVLEATREGIDPGDYGYVKERVDSANKAVNLDQALFVAQVKRSVYGKAGFEIVLDGDGWPAWLLSLQSPRLKPNLDTDWRLTGYGYEGRDGFYGPGEVLYFVNLQLEADMEGLSDVEPVRGVCGARHDLLRENFPEIVRTLWAPYTVLKADTSGLSEEEATRAVEELARVARAGKSIAVNESVEPTVVNITPDIRGLCDLLDRLDQAIIGGFGTPRFLLGKPVENRATAYAELEALIEMSDAEIDGRIGAQSPSDKLVKKLSALITAQAVKTRQPQAVSLGEYREETGSALEVWEREIERIYRLKGTPTIKGSEYGHIDEEKRYPE